MDSLLLGALAGSARAENRHAYHKVDTATVFHESLTPMVAEDSLPSPPPTYTPQDDDPD